MDNQLTILVYIFIGTFLLFVGNQIHIIRYFVKDKFKWKNFFQADFNWYLKFPAARKLMLINYLAYSFAFLLIPSFPNSSIAGPVPVYAAFLLGFVPVVVHISCNYWMWILAKAFNLLYYYKTRMEGFKGLNITVNMVVGCYIWFMVFLLVQFVRGELNNSFLTDFFLMVYSWKHIVLMIGIHITSVIVLKQWDFAPDFYNALYEAVYPEDQATAQEEEELQAIEAETQSDSFAMDLSKLIYATSDGNYTDIFICQHQEIKCWSKRISVKKLMEQLEDCSNFMRTHKSFIVNLDFVESFSGNSHGLKLELKLEGLEQVPVSRSKVKEFKMLYENYKQIETLEQVLEESRQS